jgi:phosphomannomutase
MVAEDIASESLIKLWQWIQDNPVENIEPMLLSILRNKALDYLRHESMKQQVITRISEKQNEELALRLSSLEDCNPNEIFSKEVMDIVQRTLQYFTEDGTKISVRPSGTEPKIKFYIEVRGEMKSRADYNAADAAANVKVEAVRASLGV